MVNSSGVDITKILSSAAKNNVPTSGLTATKNERTGTTKILSKKKDEHKLWTPNYEQPSTAKTASKKDNTISKAHNHKPPVPQLTISKDQGRRKKKESKDRVVVLGRDNSKSSVVLQKNTKINGNESTMATKKNSSGGASVQQLKQQLFEAQRDLGKEKNTREMLENKVTSLSNELKVIREKLGGEDKHYCISSCEMFPYFTVYTFASKCLSLCLYNVLPSNYHFPFNTSHSHNNTSVKEELEFEQNLRIKCTEDLTQANNVVIEEQKKIRALEKEVESQKRANDAIKSELQEAKKELESKMTLQQPLQNELSEEKQKTRDLQKRLQYEAAASIALRMELQAIKGRSNRVAEQLKEELRVERSKDRSSENVGMKRELQSANEKLQRLRLEKSNASHELHPQSTDKSDDSEKDQLIRKLRKELHEVRERLKSERRKTTHAQPARKKQQQNKLSLSDWVDVAPTTSAQRSAQHPGLIPILQSPPRNATRALPRSVETSLPGSHSLTSSPVSPPTADSCAASSRPPPASALSSLFHFEDDDVSVAHDKDIEPLHDELTFLKSAYDSDEIVFEGNNKVTHLLELTTGYDSDSTISIAITVLIPNGYPASGVLDIKASIQGANCSHGVRKCALDALPKLEEICMWEAEANEGAFQLL